MVGGQGLSPRMRGNRALRGAGGQCAGSIPAYAGEPKRLLLPPKRLPVYPRVCGGTMPSPQARRQAGGLSPRMRGNRGMVGHEPGMSGSIPAYAGEPQEVPSRYCCNRVYPRVCGGTAGYPSCPAHVGGLSPRMRGNPCSPETRRPLCRSIPAYAGEPDYTAPAFPNVAVYPRVCGGTYVASGSVRETNGLSPRMRGNRGAGGAGDCAGGSIPAYAGEPRYARRLRTLSGVYPRVCGGTEVPSLRREVPSGLSPRMRGNPAPLLECQF